MYKRQIREIPFSSERKCSGLELSDGSCYLLGAPEMVLGSNILHRQPLIEEAVSQGLRVLALAGGLSLIHIYLGDILTKTLSDAGIGVLHDTTHHDASYNGAYDRSAATVKSYLEKYPSIKVVLDIHRDAIQPEEGVILRPVAEINGREAAQVMIISGCDDGTMNMPNYFSNLRFAAALQSSMEGMYPGLTRPVFFCYRKYNMDLSPGALLIELGSHGNTLEQVSYSAELVGNALVSLLQQQTAGQ